MKELSYLLKRVVHMVPVLLIVTILIFLMIRAIPGDAAQARLGDKATPEALAAMRIAMGLDKPLIVQYFIFMRDILTGDLGRSTLYNRPVSELLLSRLPVTAGLVVMTALMSLLFAFPLGYYSGVKRDSAFDHIAKTSALFVISFPEFWIGTLLLLLLAVKVRVFPVGGWGRTGFDHIRALILPSFTNALHSIGLLMRNLRSNIIDVRGADYVDFARNKGLTESTVMSKHVLRNAIISTVTLFALRICYTFGSGIIIETVFALPGLGSLLVSSIFARDYSVVQSTVLILAFVIMIVNLIVDFLYSLLDPRVTLE